MERGPPGTRPTAAGGAGCLREVGVIDSVRIHPSIEPIAVEWAQLASTVGATPYLWPGWCAAWLDAFGGNADLRISSAWRDGELVGVLPMCVTPTGVASPANDQSPLFGPLALDVTAAATLASAAVAQRPQRVDLGYMDPAEPATARYTAALHGHGYRRLVQQTLRAPYTALDGDWAAYATRLSRNRRKALRRTERRLREQGDLQFEIHDGGDDLDALLAEGFRVEGSGWKGREGTSIDARPAHRRFYLRMARWASEHKWLRLAFLRLDGQAIAFELLLDHDGVRYDLKGGYDERYRTWGPGILLMQHIVRDACDVGAERIEWLGTDDGYKLEWSDGTRECVTATWLAPTVRGRAEYHGRRLGRAALARSHDTLRGALPEPTRARLRAAVARARGDRTGEAGGVTPS